MRPPDWQGVGGRAWLIPNKSDVPDHQATIAGWLVNAPGCHPFWSWWTVHVIHLRDIRGVKPAHKRYPEAEYEFVILAIHPDHPADPDHPEKGYHYLTPANVVEQFHGVTDRDAGRFAELAVRSILDGRMSPDQDYRSAWRATVKDTIAHFREGRHRES